MFNLNDAFLDRMKQLLGEEYEDFLNSLSMSNVKSILVNENKISVEKFKSIIDFDIEPIVYEKAGFYVDNEKKGRHALHHAGAFYLQEPSAMFTVNAYNFKGDEIVLDMCAAPGGKSIQIANRLPNGVLVSNEIVQNRSQILFSNIERMGLRNVIITNEKPSNISKVYSNTFDVCLVDAPCSGEGMFRKGEEISAHWNESLPQMCAQRQLEILCEADKCLKQNGVLIYSTCTYSKEENEDVVNAFIKEFGYELISIQADLTRGVSMPEAVRLYPHKVRGEGQFVAVLRKKSENLLNSGDNLKLKLDKSAMQFIRQETNKDYEVFEFKQYSYIVPTKNLIKKNINYVSLGVRVGENLKTRFEPHHNLFMAFKKDFKLQLDYDFNSKEVQKYLIGDTNETNLEDGFGVISCNGCALGGFKISKGKFKNFYPKGLRNFK